MGWSEYHLDAPGFCTPLPVMRGLVSAVCERRDVVDSEFHESCMSSGMQAVTERCLTDMLFCSSAQEIPFREIKKEYASDPLHGGRRNLTFMHMFDNFLFRTLNGYGGTLDMRWFTDSTGCTVYSSFQELSSELSEMPILPETVFPAISSTVRIGTDFQVCLNAAWAAQRARMLKLLRYVGVSNGGLIIRYAEAEGYFCGGSPQDAYDSIPSRTLTDSSFTGEYWDLECREVYYHDPMNNPEERWVVETAREATVILPDFHGCPATPRGTLMFDAVQPDNDLHPDYIVPFDPLCTDVSSGANTLAMSGGSFASWGFGSASGIGGPSTPSGTYIRGWQARNVRIVYDYEPIYDFKQEE